MGGYEIVSLADSLGGYIGRIHHDGLGRPGDRVRDELVGLVDALGSDLRLADNRLRRQGFGRDRFSYQDLGCGRNLDGSGLVSGDIGCDGCVRRCVRHTGVGGHVRHGLHRLRALLSHRCALLSHRRTGGLGGLIGLGEPRNGLVNAIAQGVRLVRLVRHGFSSVKILGWSDRFMFPLSVA